ncbi:MAG: hypothetical protein M5U05_02485 [Anaerolineales bacterium]|nr:hypothetical protein [Anaerolineales bacterium]
MASVNTNRSERRICIVPQARGVGGMVTFTQKLKDGLSREGIEVTHRLDAAPIQAVLVVGGRARWLACGAPNGRESPSCSAWTV